MSAYDDLFGPVGLKTYKSSTEAYKQDVVPRSTGSAMDDLFGTSTAAPAAPVAAPVRRQDAGDFGRGFGIAGKQLKQTGYGAAALIGDTVGSDSLKQWGLKGYKEGEKEIQAVSKDSDSFTTAIDKGPGSVVDWLQYAAGYLSGQAVETLAAAGAGALVGGAMSGPAAPAGAVGGAVAGAINRTAVQTGVKAAIGKMVDREAERLVLKGVAANVAAQQAAKSVYRDIGAKAGMTLVNATQELGSIYGEAVEEAKGGDVDLARVWLSGIAATAVESWADSKALGGITDAIKGKTRGASIAVEAFKGGLREGLTEGVQTAIERFGATKDLASAEAFKEYIDSAAIGVLGGTVTGGVKGAVSKLTVPGQPADPNVDPANPDPTSLPTPPGRGRDPDSDAPMLLREDVWSTLQNAPMMAAMYVRGDEAQQKAIIKSIDRANLRGEFEAAFKDRALMERNEKIVSEYPDLIDNTVAGIQKFADTMPWPKFKVDFRTTGGTLADEDRAAAPPEEPTLPAGQAEIEPTGDPSVAPSTALPERQGPQGDQRTELITKFNEVGTQIFDMNPGQTQDAKFDWAMNQLVQTHGFSNKDARAILTGSMRPEAVNATTETGPAGTDTQLDIQYVRGGPTGSFLEGAKKIGEGSESDVYLSGDSVIKVSEPYSDKSEETFRKRIADALNVDKVLGDGTLEYVGHYLSPNGTKNPVFRQPLVEGRPATRQEIRSYMEARGFSVEKEGSTTDTFTKTEGGQTLIARDLDGDNVKVDANGNVRVIDGQLDVAPAKAQGANTSKVENVNLPDDDDAALPRDIRSVKMTQKNRPLLDAYFADEIASLQKKQDGNGKTERLAQLERQALRVGFSQSEVDQMFGRSSNQGAATAQQVGQAIDLSAEVTRYNYINDGLSYARDNLNRAKDKSRLAYGMDKRKASTERIAELQADVDQYDRDLKALVNEFGQPLLDAVEKARAERRAELDKTDRLKSETPLQKIYRQEVEKVSTITSIPVLERMVASKRARAREFAGQKTLSGGDRVYGAIMSEIRAAEDRIKQLRAEPSATEQARTELNDAAANLFDVLTDITGAKQNITGQRYTVKDLPKALTRVMQALIEKGVTSFKDASAQLMQRLRESKDWSHLSDKVDQGMLLKAWNEAGGGKSQQGNDPASTLRTQTRAVKGSKGDTLITNQNPINARSFYMTPEEVKENQRAADELKSGEAEEVKGEKAADGDDFAGEAMYPVKPENGEAKKRTESAKPYYRQALSQAKTLLSGRLAYVGKKPKPERLTSMMLDEMGFDMFKVRLADDSSGSGKKALDKIRSDLNAAVKAFENKKAEKKPAPMPTEQQRLALPRVERKSDPAPIVKLKGMIEGFIKNMTNASYYEETIRVLNEQLAKIDARLNEVNEFQTDSGETFRVRNRGDSNPGMWGLQDENAYDRFDGGMVFDKATPKNALLDLRRKISDDIKIAREQSVKGRARLYRLGIDRLGDYIVERGKGAIRGGVSQELVLAAVNPYLDGLGALREAEAKVVDQAAETDPALAEANRNLAQEDLFEGERVAIGILSDFKAKKIGKAEVQVLETRGIREGDFTFTDLLRAYRAMGISPSQSLYAWTKHFSTRIRLKDYIAQNGGRASAADAYFADMLAAQALMSPDEFARRYGAQEKNQLTLWKDYRSKVLARRHITPRMRDPLKKDPRKVFDGFLFTRISLEEARNPDTIQSTTLRLTYKSLFDNLEDAWFSDLAAALRLRPDMESELFNPEPDFFYEQSLGERIQAIQESGQLSTPTAAVAADPVISPQERAAFKQWVERIKAGIQKQAEVMARSPYFEELRNDPRLEAVRTAEGYPMVASTPRYDEYVTETRGVRSETFNLTSPVQPDMFRSESAGRPDNRPIAYEALYVKVANGELQAVQDFLEFNARFKAYGNGMVDLETGELLSAADADQLHSDALQSVMMNAQMESSLTKKGNVNRQFAAKIRGDEKVVRTVEEAAERDAQIGGTANVSMEDLTSEEQIQEGVISEFESEESYSAYKDSEADGDEDSEADGDEDSEADGDGGAEQGTAAQEREEKPSKGSRVPRSLIPGMEYRFRRGPAWDVVTAAMVQDIVNQITSTWTNATNIVVIPNAQHLPPEIREKVLEKLAGDGAKGLYHDGTVYLFSQHLTGEPDVEFTLFHEAYGHLGMRALLGDKFDQFLETAYRVNAKVKAEVDALVAGGMPKLEAIDEVLSDMAAENRQVGIVNQWVAKVIAGLREIGMNSVADFLSSMTGAEIASTLAQARDAARNGATPAMNGAPDEIRFSLKHRPPYEIFSTSGNKTTAYARYNPATDTWAVFHTFESKDIRDNYTGFVSDNYSDVVDFMRKQGKVDYRTRSGMYIDDKIVGDMVRLTGVGKRDNKLANWWRNMVIGFQNEYLPVFEMVDYLRGLGRIDDRVDVKTDLLLYERRTGAKLDKFRREYVDPIMRLVREAGALGATEADVNRYITARHAEERNRAVAAINPSIPDGGSGLVTTKEGIEKYPELNAYKILEDLRASPAGMKLEEIGLMLDRVSEQKIAYMVKTGLITKKAAQKLQRRWNEEKGRWEGYSHYVNLSGVMTPEGMDTVDQFDDPMALAGGSKFNAQKGKERRAFGRGTGNLSPDVLGRTIQSFEAQLIRGQKNEVAKKVLALIETNYDPAFAVINKIPMRRELNYETGLVEEVVDEGYMARKDVMVAKVSGIPVTIEFKDTSRGSFAEAIHGYVAPREPNNIMEWIGKANQIFGQMLTTWNPAWVFVNFFRDVQTLYFNSAADGRITKQMARDMLKNLWPAFKVAAYMASEGKANIKVDPEMLRVFKEMRDSGGITNFANFKDLESRVRDIKVSLSGNSGLKQKGKALLDFMEKISLPVETASRLAAYKVVRDNGWSKEQAAVYSGEVTVNFNLRGNQRWVRQLFVFFNPAVQGTEKLYRLAKENPKKMAMYAGLWAGLGMMATVIARLFGDDDEEDKIPALDKISPYKRATSVVLFPDVPFGALPIPYGWNAPYSFGTFLMDSVMGAQPWTTSIKRAAKASAEAMLPPPIMQGADSKTIEGKIAKTLAPTLGLPVIEYALNENRYGAPIYKGKSPFDDAEVPDAQKYFRGVSPISRAITDGLTSVTGGTKYRAGAIDVNPATMDFLIYSYTPGLLAEGYKLASTGVRYARGETIKRTPLPIIDRFTAPINQGYEAGAYRRASEIVETLYKEYSNSKDQERRKEIRDEFPRLSAAHATIASAKRDLRDINKRIADLDTKPISSDEKVRRTNELRGREEQIYKRATKRLMEAGPQVSEAILANE